MNGRFAKGSRGVARGGSSARHNPDAKEFYLPYRRVDTNNPRNMRDFRETYIVIGLSDNISEFLSSPHAKSLGIDGSHATRFHRSLEAALGSINADTSGEKTTLVYVMPDGRSMLQPYSPRPENAPWYPTTASSPHAAVPVPRVKGVQNAPRPAADPYLYALVETSGKGHALVYGLASEIYTANEGVLRMMFSLFHPFSVRFFETGDYAERIEMLKRFAENDRTYPIEAVVTQGGIHMYPLGSRPSR